MARSAREIIDDHVAGGQAKLVAYRKQYEGSGQYVAPTKYAERDSVLLESLLNARDVLEEAQFGVKDHKFLEALERWAASEWGGFFDRKTMIKTRPLRQPKKREHLRGDNAHAAD